MPVPRLGLASGITAVAVRSVPPKSCGSILTSVLPVDPTFETQIRRKASLYFRIQTIKQNGKEVKVVYGKGTSWATEQDGRCASPWRSLQDFEAHLFRRKSPFGSVTFEVGTDLRSCWGDLYDWEDRKVCDVASLKDLLEDVKKQSEMKMDAVGKSGAAIVTNLRRFILKNLQECIAESDGWQTEVLHEATFCLLPNKCTFMMEELSKNTIFCNSASNMLVQVLCLVLHKRHSLALVRRKKILSLYAKSFQTLQRASERKIEIMLVASRQRWLQSAQSSTFQMLFILANVCIGALDFRIGGD
eukprot:g9392.t1